MFQLNLGRLCLARNNNDNDTRGGEKREQIAFNPSQNFDRVNEAIA